MEREKREQSATSKLSVCDRFPLDSDKTRNSATARTGHSTAAGERKEMIKEIMVRERILKV